MARLFTVLLLLAFVAAGAANGGEKGVKYDGRSLIINGRRELIFSGSIHYTRSTPDVWPKLIARAKQGGLNTIDTYVFWNVHEPSPGQYYFEGKYDLIRFLKLIQQQKMYVILRIGPFIQAEWKFGGFPFWLREVTNITFRTNNQPYKEHMERFTTLIVKMMKDENLFAPQGGPIILSQIENEYSMVQATFKEEGERYIEWAVQMAVGLDAGIPWIMCKQINAPDAVIVACNGRKCGDKFDDSRDKNKPMLWSENWTAQFRMFGDPPAARAAEDLAFHVARFFSKGGALMNYYMYHGGTNFGRSGGDFVLTRYYDEAPLDEYGLPKDPKQGHLKDLHRALSLSRKALLWGAPSREKLGKNVEVWLYEVPENNVCAAFLTNKHPKEDKTVNFRGVDYFLPHVSISILPDCKTVVFNTKMVNAQHNSRTFRRSRDANKNNNWQMHQEAIPLFHQTGNRSTRPQDLIELIKDNTDYAWYTTQFHLEDDDLPMRNDIRPTIQIGSLGHALHVFVNGEYIGNKHGTRVEKAFVFQSPVTLKEGINHIAILGVVIGLPDDGPYLERRRLGVHIVTIQGLMTGTLDLTLNTWAHKAAVEGEVNRIYDPRETDKVQWSNSNKGLPMTWYKRSFDTPRGKEPVVLDMSSMGKGFVYINGENIGRYWTSFNSSIGEPSQSEYHVPRHFLKPTDNIVVIFEEEGGDPQGVEFKTVSRDIICTVISDFYPALITSWARENNQILSVTDDLKPTANLHCGKEKMIKSINFASFGNPQGACGNFSAGSCHSRQAKIIAEKACVGKQSCSIPVSYEAFHADPRCQGTRGTLAIQAKCSRRKK